MIGDDKHFSLPIELYDLPSLVAHMNFRFVESVLYSCRKDLMALGSGHSLQVVFSDHLKLVWALLYYEPMVPWGYLATLYYHIFFWNVSSQVTRCHCICEQIPSVWLMAQCLSQNSIKLIPAEHMDMRIEEFGNWWWNTSVLNNILSTQLRNCFRFCFSDCYDYKKKWKPILYGLLHMSEWRVKDCKDYFSLKHMPSKCRG